VPSLGRRSIYVRVGAIVMNLDDGQWKNRAWRAVEELKKDGWMTSGDAANLLGISKTKARYHLGQPGKIVQQGGIKVLLWRRDVVETFK